MSIQQLAQGFFLSNTFLGIGTTAPTASFHVYASNTSDTFRSAGLLVENGGVGETGIGLRNAVMGTRAWVIGTDSNSTRLDMSYGIASNQLVAGDARLSVTSDGRVGVGITDPSFAVDVNGYVRSSLGFRVGNNEVIDSDGNFVIRTVQLLDSSGGTALYVTNAGNVGIGTDNPQNKLDIIGTAGVTGNMGIGTTNPTHRLHIYSTSTTNNDYESSGLFLENAATGEAALSIRGGAIPASSNWFLGVNSNQTRLDIGYGLQTSQLEDASTDLTILANGNVGIGTTIPQQRLQVDGTIRATQFVGDGSLLTNIQASSPTLWSIGGGSNNFTMCNVGIGITNPQKQLEISGTNATLRISDYTANGTPTIEFVRGTSNTFGGDVRTDWRITASNNQLIIGEGDTNGNSNVLTLTQDGNALLGTSTQWASYRSTSNVYWARSNLLLPTANGTLNGVNITAMNRRTRASYATAKAAVSTWIPRTLTGGAENEYWYAVCWSPDLSLFCAVSENAMCITSADGIKWSTHDLTGTGAENTDWYSMCWSPELSLFCAVGYPNGTGNAKCVMTSLDGSNWTVHDLSTIGAQGGQWYSVCWSPELSLFCAVAWNGYVMTSPDGRNWTMRDIPITLYNLGSVCWSPELSIFCVVGKYKVLTSGDGSTWRAHDLSGTGAEFHEWYSISWSPELSRFCAVGTNNNGGITNLVMTSSDGISWTIRNIGEGTKLYGICWSPDLSLFCAVSYIHSRILTSPDGIQWSMCNLSVNNFSASICWSPELSTFCAIGWGETPVTMSRPALPAPQSAVLANPSHATVNPATGNVGIGTTNPTHRLHVYSSNTMIERASLFVENAATGEAALAIRGGVIPSTSNWFIGVNSNQTRLDIGYGLDNVRANMSFLTDGNVGIGTTIPQQLFHVEGNASIINGNVGIGTTIPQQLFHVEGNASIINGNVGIGTTIPQQLLHVEGNASIINGNVGIGTHTPLANLHIHDDASFSNIYNLPFDETGENFIRIYEFSIPSGFLDNLQACAYFTVGNSGPLRLMNYIEFGPYTKTEIYYTPSGTALPSFGNYPMTLYYPGKTIVKNMYVGIGTDNPRQLFHIDGGRAIITNGITGIGTFHPRQLLHVEGGNSIIVNGNVGIGTHTPQDLFHVENGDVYIDHNMYRTYEVNIEETGTNFFKIMQVGVSAGFLTDIQSCAFFTVGNNGPYQFANDISYDSSGPSTKLVFYYTPSGSPLPEYVNQVVKFYIGNGKTIIKNGNVGINTSSPNAALHIFSSNATSNVAAAGIILQNAGVGEVGLVMRTGSMPSSNSWCVGVDANSTRLDVTYGTTTPLAASDAKLSVTSGGLVGIGITNPSFALDVTGYVRSSLGFRVGATEVIDADGNFLARNIQMLDGSGNTSLYVAESGLVGIGTDNPQQTLHVQGNALLGGTVQVTTGNVGIGYTNPLERLMMTGYLRLDGNPALPTTGAGTFRIGGGFASPNAGRIIFGDSSGWRVNFSTVTGGATVDRVSIVDTGRIGIGTTSPEGMVHAYQASTGYLMSAFSGTTRAFGVNIGGTAGGTASAQNTVMILARDTTTLRSINAAGTVNASGADYAEYMLKERPDIMIKKGDIVGVTSDGKLTTKWSESIHFVIKSSNPSLVGGDNWAEDIGERPQQPQDQASDEEKATYHEQLLAWEHSMEEARKKVDRIAFSGQVPVNVQGSLPGDYIVPQATDEDGICGVPIATSQLTFEQYRNAVGRVIKVLPDGRAFVIVKVC